MATLPETTSVAGAAPVEDVPVAGAPAHPAAFEVRLENFSGPFDLLLSLIAKHKLDVTEIALGQVTDDFIAYIRAADKVAADAAAAQGTATSGFDDAGRPVRRLYAWDLGTASEFLVVAATLLDLKAARLLPAGDVESAEDLELLEARDLLFARLLQYRAYKQVSAVIADRLATEGRRFPRIVQLEPHLAALLPELVWQLGPDQLAALAAKAIAPKPPPPGVDLAHLHAPAVSVREQAGLIIDRLRRVGSASFRDLVDDADVTLVVVARFLALLELFREGAVAFDQVAPLGELTVRWTGDEQTDTGEVLGALGAEFDELDEVPGDVSGEIPSEADQRHEERA